MIYGKCSKLHGTNVQLHTRLIRGKKGKRKRKGGSSAPSGRLVPKRKRLERSLSPSDAYLPARLLFSSLPLHPFNVSCIIHRYHSSPITTVDSIYPGFTTQFLSSPSLSLSLSLFLSLQSALYSQLGRFGYYRARWISHTPVFSRRLDF